MYAAAASTVATGVLMMRAGISSGGGGAAHCASIIDSVTGGGGKLASAAGFDPEALERGAKALKEINKSPVARQVVELTKTQEITKQQELKTKEKQAVVEAERMQVERERVRWEEQRKAVQEQAQMKAQLQQQNDELTRKRMHDENEAARARNAELVRMQEESVSRQEQLRRSTEERVQSERRETERYKNQLEQESIRAKALAEAEGRIKEAKAMEKATRENIGVRVEAETKKMLKLVNTTFDRVGQGFTTLFSDPKMLTTAVGALAAASLSIYASREAIRIGGKQLEKFIGQPPLVRETSRRALWLPSFTSSSGTASLENVKLPDQLHKQLTGLIAFTSNAKEHGSAFRHMLFYGSPGTGKTMAAREFATQTGMDYAILSGGDVAPLGSEAVTKIHEVFDWAKRSSKGVVLFIDEAEAFLSSRGDNQPMSEGKRAALNTLLAQTGGATTNYCIVLATNRPEDLDEAMVDRIDEALEFPLPGAKEREAIIRQQMEGQTEGVRRAGIFARPPTRVGVDADVDKAIAAAAQSTKGFSGRQLEKLVSAIRARALSSSSPTINAAMVDEIVAMKVAEAKARGAFRK